MLQLNCCWFEGLDIVNPQDCFVPALLAGNLVIARWVLELQAWGVTPWHVAALADSSVVLPAKGGIVGEETSVY